MLDNGANGDVLAGDGIYTAQIPTSGVGAGQMLRWRIIATDSAGTIATAPPYTVPTDCDQYFGTVAQNSAIVTQLPVVYTFMQDTVNCDTTTGTRCSFFYNNFFYDNVFVSIHGQSTQTFPKKSNGFNFNADNACQFFDNVKPVKGINLLSNYADKSKVRNTLAYEYINISGCYGHLGFPVRVQRNGAFYEIADAIEQGDENFLERLGLDATGAFYKMYNGLDNATSNVEKKTRTNESNADLQTLISNLDEGISLTERRRYLYDNINIPQCISYFVALSLVSSIDHGHKNFYVYRDSNNSGDWALLPWDVDLTWGRNYSGTQGYFDDGIYSNNSLIFAVDYSRPADRLYDLFFAVPELEAMYARRMRTVMDNVLQLPSTTSANGAIETRIRALMDAMDPPAVGVSDADMDYQNWAKWGNNYDMRTEALRIITTHIPGRRVFLYNQNPTINGEPIPSAQAAHPALSFSTFDSNPVSGNQDEEYVAIKNSNNFAVDISGWKLDGGVRFTFKPGTIIPAGGGTTDNIGLLFVARNPRLFRLRSVTPHMNQFCFVQGPYDGQLSARGDTVGLYDTSGALIASLTTPAAPTPSQLNLRITELNYAPAAPSATEIAAIPGVSASDFEYLEVTNMGTAALDLAGAAISKGVDFTFSAGTTLAPGASTLVVGNLGAFRLRYGAMPPVAGQFVGNLDNTGETVVLTDKSGEKVVEFTYDGTWLPVTNQGGYSLVARTPATTPYDGYNDPTAWAISGAKGGSPGYLDPFFSVDYKSWLNDHFTLTEQLDALLAGASADPDADGLVNFMEYLEGGDPRVSDHPSLPEWASVVDGGNAYGSIGFNRRIHAIDINLVVEAATNPQLSSWISVGSMLGSPVADGTEMEHLIVRDDTPLSQTYRALRVRDTLSGKTWIARMPQDISFPMPPDIPYPSALVPLNASSNSGLNVSLNVVTGPASVVSGSLQITGTGMITVSATQSGNDGFFPATEVIRTFTVSKSDQSIDFPSIEDFPYAPQPIQLMAHASSSLPVTFSLISGPALLQDGKLIPQDCGVVVVAASQSGNDCYNAAIDVQRSFQINKAEQSIDFVPAGSVSYLDPPVELNANATSGLPVVLHIVSGPGTLDANTLAPTGAGTIVIAADQSGDSRYLSAAATLTIEVKKAAVSLSWRHPQMSCRGRYWEHRS